MKKTVQKEINACDFCCCVDECYTKCLRCGKDVCYSCESVKGIEYPHSLYFSGSFDGWYCLECDAKDDSELHNLYLKIKAIRREAKCVTDDLKARNDEIESRIAQLRKI